MYYALAVFSFFVSLSGFAMVLGNTAQNDSGPVVLVCSTIIGISALFALIACVALIKWDRKRKSNS